MNRTMLILILGCAIVPQIVQADGLKAGAAAAVLVADDSMVIGGGIGPGKARGQEGKLRASAVVIQGPSGERAALIACDVLMIERDILDRAAQRVGRETGIPFDHILINATHTYHAPTTVTVHPQARGSLALVLPPGRPGGRDGEGGNRPLLRGGVGIDPQPRRAGHRGNLSDQARGC